MAEDARTVAARAGLDALATRFAALAAERERQDMRAAPAGGASAPDTR